MKLEKREITLNECDSLRDAFYIHKTLLSEYICALENTLRTETRKELVRMIKETCEDLFFVRDLMRAAKQEDEE